MHLSCPSVLAAMSSSPVLPYHASDARPSMSPTPTLTSQAESQDEKTIARMSLSRRPTKSTVRWTQPYSPGSPRTPRTTRTARTGTTTRTATTTRSSAHDTIEAAMSQLGEENNVWDPERADGDESGSTKTTTVVRVRRRVGQFLQQEQFHYTIIGLVILDLVDVFVDLTLSLLSLACFTDSQIAVFTQYGLTTPPESPSCVLHETPAVTGADWFLFALSVFLLCIFVLEIFASLFAFGTRHFLRPIYAIDAVVVIASLFLEVFFQFDDGGKSATSPAALIILRLWKIIRAIHAIAHSIELKNLEIIKAVRESLAEIEVEHAGTAAELERTHIKVEHLMKRVPDVQEEELDRIIDEELERRRHAMESPQLQDGPSEGGQRHDGDEKSIVS